MVLEVSKRIHKELTNLKEKVILKKLFFSCDSCSKEISLENAFIIEKQPSVIQIEKQNISILSALPWLLCKVCKKTLS